MKVCYVDESGNRSNDPFLVMIGIVVDTYRLNRTRTEFGQIFDVIQDIFQENLRELKGSKMIMGRSRWRKVAPSTRDLIADFLCKWVGGRKHSLVLAAIDRQKLSTIDSGPQIPKEMSDPWLAAALHVALQLQRAHQKIKSNKGTTFLVFDENKMKADNFAEMLWQCPSWADTYYGRTRKQEALDQLVDTAFTVKSHHVGLVQVADLYSFLFRRYAELEGGATREEFSGERELIGKYVGILSRSLLPKSHRWPSRTGSPCARWYSSIAPDPLLALG